MSKINLKIDYLKIANYALHHNRVPICNALTITNDSTQDYLELQVHCEGEYIQSYSSAIIPTMKHGDSVRLKDFVIAPVADKLAALTERITTQFTIKVTAEGDCVHEQTFDIELMAFDQWTGLTIQPQSIASFVTPNHPSVSAVVLKASEILKKVQGDTTFHGYMSGNSNIVHIQAATIFEAVQQYGIVYREVPASFEAQGQRVSMPEKVLASRLGNCIELTILLASALEAIGINTGIVFVNGHAFLAVWLVPDTCPYSMCDDVSWLEKRCSYGIDEMIVVESTCVTNGCTFDQAIQSATLSLSHHEDFVGYIDIKRCRLERYLPLPSRIEKDGVFTIDDMSVQIDERNIDTAEHDRYDLSQLRESQKELTKYDIWERKLLDFSLRNTLLNLYLRKRAIQFISFDIDRIEDHLQDGEEYCIFERPETDVKIEETTERLYKSKLLDGLRPLISDDIENHRLHTYLSEKESTSILKNIYRTARNSIEETGANSLFLSIGTVRWYENNESDTPRFAPLLLLPVEMVYKKGRYYIRSREEDITLNITLMEFMRQNFDINIKGVNPLPKDDSGVDVKLIFAAVRDALKEQKRWDVEEECLLGIFSFSKFLMWNDIHFNHDKLADNAVVNSLVHGGLTWQPSAITGDLKNIDGTVSPDQTAIPVPVDSSQMAAIIEGGKGNSFILYGPPGTGKSQTITNLIANALYNGKRVLFVAEKMAALSVVQNRLAKIGLDPFCLELHSNKATKRHVLEQLDKALHVTHIMPPEKFKETADKIFEERKALINYMHELHTVDPHDGMSLYDYIAKYESIDTDPMPEFVFDDKVNGLLSAEGIKAIEELLGSKLVTIIKLVGQPSQHNLNGLHVDRDMLMSASDIAEAMAHDATELNELQGHRSEMESINTLRDKLLRDNAPALLEQDTDELYDEWRSAKAKWFIPRFFAKRKFIKKLRAFNGFITADDVDALFDDLFVYHKQQNDINKMQSIIVRYQRQSFAQDQIPQSQLVENVITRLDKWSSHTSQMRDWLHWCEYSDTLKASGLSCVVDALETRKTNPQDMCDAYLKALFKNKIEAKINKSALMATFEGMIFDEQVKIYKQLTEEFQNLTQKELYARLASRIPRLSNDIDSNSEIGLLNRNVSSGGRGVSLRDLFDQIPTLLPRLCPCMLMSPMSVAQYIDLGAEKFDLVVFDEASQMPTSEAVGAIARGKSLIVVGDPKQMPPTSFFTSTNVDEDEAHIDDLESILEDCRTLEMPSLQLNWHYRSRHESLIAFSNNEYYDGSLITFPSIDDQETKVKYVPIEGYYDKGGKRSNKAEAEAIVEEIARRLRDQELSKLSIGVIAFSVVQQALIEDLLQEKFDNEKDLREIAENMYEPIFIKNLENVQGDERDIILFSIGYGPNKEGKVSMNFGPLNNAGGERRLNVAVSRARHEMHVYSTLKSSHIDLRRSKARGVEGLKHFLEYAESQSLVTVEGSAQHSRDTIIAQQIAQELNKLGYKTTTSVGRSQFKVDVAISDKDNPDVYKLGILLDGEGYRDTQTTRDREVVQPSVLNSLNWVVMRVWSLDWYNNRQRVLDRIIEKYNTTTDNLQPSESKPASFDISQEQEIEVSNCAIAYTAYETTEQKAKSMSDHELMSRIIETEQPITFSLLCKRVAALRGLARAGAATQNGLKAYTPLFHNEPDRSSVTLWKSKEDCMTYSQYRASSNRDISEIPMAEIKNVILEAIREQIALPVTNLTLIAAKKLGYTRRGTNVDAALNEAVKQLHDVGMIENIDGKLRMAN